MNLLTLWTKRTGLTVALVLAFAKSAFALTAPASVPSTFTNLGDSVSTIFNVVILIAGVAFVILFLVGGIQYLLAAGNEETSGKAKKLLLDAVIGLIIVLAAWAIGTWILNQLGTPVSDIQNQ